MPGREVLRCNACGHLVAPVWLDGYWEGFGEALRALKEASTC